MTLLALALALVLADPAPPVTTATLVGLTETAAKEQLGEPDIARKEDKGAMWTYRKQGCVLLVYLADAPGEGLKVTGAAASPRRAGETPPETDACIVQPKA